MSGELRIVADPHAPQSKRQVVIEGIDLHNVAATGLDEYHPVAFFLEGPEGEVRGGLLGEIWGGWLQVHHLWVGHRLRGQGHGAALLAAAERYAAERGAGDGWLGTFSFQALGFYEKHGYQRFATLPDHPRGHAEHFLRKRLG